MIKSYIETFAKYGGLVTVTLEWLAVAYFYLARPDEFKGDNTISYLSTLPENHIVFSICITAAAISFWIFTRFHLHKHYVVSNRLFAISMLGYAAVALVPFDPTSVFSETIHKILALIFTVSLLAGIYLLAKNNADTKLRLFSYTAVAGSTFFLAVFLTTPKESPNVMLFEALGAFICQLWIIWITFHIHKHKPVKHN